MFKPRENGKNAAGLTASEGAAATKNAASEETAFESASTLGTLENAINGGD